jgi:hypothetical protein
LQSFRCTRFGVKCEVNGTTADAMNTVGGKDQCSSNEASAYLADVGRYATYLSGLKPDPRDVIFAALAGAEYPFNVELRAPAGGGAAIPALAHSCAYAGATGTEVADPPSRIATVAKLLRRGSMDNVCNDLGSAMTSLGQRVKSLVGDPCLVRQIALPAVCEVFDIRGTTETFVPACDGAHTTDCFSVVSDPALCPAGQQLKLDVTRSAAPSADTWTSLRCAL